LGIGAHSNTRSVQYVAAAGTVLYMARTDVFSKKLPAVFARDVLYSTVKSSPVTGLERPRGFQEIKVPRFRDNGTGW